MYNTHTPNQTHISLLRVPLELGAHYGGTHLGPAAYDKLNITQQLQSAGFDVFDAGSIDCPLRADTPQTPPDKPGVDQIIRVAEQTAAVVAEQISKQRVPVVLGGDHSLTLGTFAGARASISGTLGMVYIDAHGDINTPASSTSHNLHGMHLAALMGHGSDDLVNACTNGTKLEPANLLHIAGCDFDQFELELADQLNLQMFRIHDMLLHGLAPLQKMIQQLAARVDAVWISFDLDSVNQSLAPGVGIPNAGGLTYREVVAITRLISQHCKVAGLDIVELNPPKDDHYATAQLGINTAIWLLGGAAGDYATYNSGLQIPASGS